MWIEKLWNLKPDHRKHPNPTDIVTDLSLILRGMRYLGLRESCFSSVGMDYFRSVLWSSCSYHGLLRKLKWQWCWFTIFSKLPNDSLTAFLWGFSICFFFLLLIVLQFVVLYKRVAFALCELQIVQEHIRDFLSFLFLLGIVF